MNKLNNKILLPFLVFISMSTTAVAQEIVYQTGFEASEGFSRDGKYDSADLTNGPEDHLWRLDYANVADGSTYKISGSQALVLRYYDSKSIPCAYTDFTVDNLTDLEFKVRSGASSGSVAIYYSTDKGTTWTKADAISGLTTSKTAKSCSIKLSETPLQGAQIKFVETTKYVEKSKSSLYIVIDDVKLINNAAPSPTAITIDEKADNSEVIGNCLAAKANITLTRSLSSEYWNTFCLPFSLSAAQVAETFGEGTEICQFSAVNDGIMHFSDNADGDIKAGVPYLVKPTRSVVNPTFAQTAIETATPATVEIDGYKFIGVFSQTLLSETDIFIGKDNSLHYSIQNGKLSGMRAYIQVPEGSTVSRISIREDVSGISSPIADQAPSATGVYTIGGNYAGRDAAKLQKGIYIVNGKKFLKK